MGGEASAHLLFLSFLGFFCFLCLCLCSLPLAAADPFRPADNYLITCGGTAIVHADDGRTFLPESAAPSVALPPTSDVVTAPGVAFGLYSTARVFTAPSSYSFRIKQRGRHLLRLHLSPVASPRYNLRSAAFSVSAGGFALLRGFSFARAAAASSLLKEYVIGVDSDTLLLTLSPSDGSIAFLNAVELVSTPEGLVPSGAVPIPAGAPAEIAPGRALETSYRLNVGGPRLDSRNDTLWRVWEPDGAFLVNAASARAVAVDSRTVRYAPGVTAETAPRWVYATAQEMADANVGNQRFNISWVFDVDPGFSYLVRLHFCDIVSRALNDLVFNVYINNQTAMRAFDVSSKAMELSTACFVDFVVGDDSDEMGSEKMLVQIGPTELGNVQPNAILNGLEIMKLSNADNSLDASYGAYPQGGEVMREKKKRRMAVVFLASLVGGASLLGLTVVALVYSSGHCCHRRRRRPHCEKMQQNHAVAWLATPSHMGNSESKISANTYASSGPLGLGRVLAFTEIKEATKNFDESLVLGVGGFGKVYRGVLENGDVVAVKRGNPRSQQGLVEFRTEIEMLSKLRHRHLVSLIGYCQEPNEMVLVYEYMAGGSLRKHLYGSNLPTLSWKQRLEICIGAAKGLHYLHTGAAETIIHRDVKTTNILLDENLIAKVADFGLSKMGPSLDQTHVSTAVKGSFGYLDPEYFRRQRLTEKSDVYSFGVVLMEVLCARPAINPALPRDQVNIAEWAMHWQKRGQLEHIIDPHLAATVCIDSLRIYGETAEKCLAEHGIERPTMGDVLWNLEYALQLQESFARTRIMGEEDSTSGIQDLPDWIPSIESVEHNTFSSVSVDGSDITSSSGVFSQIINPKGR